MIANSVFSFIGEFTLFLLLHNLPGGSEPFLLMSVGLPTILMQNGIAIVYVVDLAHLMSII